MAKIPLQLIIAIAMAIATTAYAAPDWNEREIAWRGYADGVAEVRRSGRPALVLLYTDWCPTCRAYREIFADRGVVRLASQLVMIRVNAAEHPEVSRLFAEDGEYLPRTYALTGGGAIWSQMCAEKGRFRHYFAPDEIAEFRRLMARVLSDWLDEEAVTLTSR